MSKIFCIGSNKTGTTSLKKALQILNYSVCPEYIMYSFNSKYFYEQKQGQYNSIFEIVKKYDAFEDRPWNHTDFYKELDNNFNDSKFILTVRNTENWLQSYRRWSYKVDLRKQWFYKLVSQICYDTDDFLSNEENMKIKYEERNKEIIEYFKNTNKLIVLNFEMSNDWELLCNFLKKDKPNVDFPHLNKSK